MKKILLICLTLMIIFSCGKDVSRPGVIDSANESKKIYEVSMESDTVINQIVFNMQNIANDSLVITRPGKSGSCFFIISRELDLRQEYCYSGCGEPYILGPNDIHRHIINLAEYLDHMGLKPGMAYYLEWQHEGSGGLERESFVFEE